MFSGRAYSDAKVDQAISNHSSALAHNKSVKLEELNKELQTECDGLMKFLEEKDLIKSFHEWRDNNNLTQR